MTADLVIPITPHTPIPAGWWHEKALPTIEATESWDDLNHLDAELKAIVGVLETLGGEDVIEVLKARRVVEKRRGELLGETNQGARTDLQLLQRADKVAVSTTAASNYRRLARSWPTLEGHLLKATDRREVAQSYLLELAKADDPTRLPHRPDAGVANGAPRAKRVAQIGRLAGEGHRAAQIADKLGIGEERVRSLARDHDITLPDAAFGKTRRIDPFRVVRETVDAAAGLAIGLSLITNDDIAQLDQSDREEWAASLNDSLRSLNRLHRQLKEDAHEQQ